ncbi:hypothetical protein L1887_53086 [Cichorium endivia]|nr:hypothetical protein L1887_53086 [Cichorium endivia]
MLARGGVANAELRDPLSARACLRRYSVGRARHHHHAGARRTSVLPRAVSSAKERKVDSRSLSEYECQGIRHGRALIRSGARSIPTTRRSSKAEVSVTDVRRGRATPKRRRNRSDSAASRRHADRRKLVGIRRPSPRINLRRSSAPTSYGDGTAYKRVWGSRRSMMLLLQRRRDFRCGVDSRASANLLSARPL